MMMEDFSADLTWICVSSPALADDWFSPAFFLSAVLLSSVHVKLRCTAEDHVTRATVQKLPFGLRSFDLILGYLGIPSFHCLYLCNLSFGLLSLWNHQMLLCMVGLFMALQSNFCAEGP